MPRSDILTLHPAAVQTRIGRHSLQGSSEKEQKEDENAATAAQCYFNSQQPNHVTLRHKRFALWFKLTL